MSDSYYFSTKVYRVATESEVKDLKEHGYMMTHTCKCGNGDLYYSYDKFKDGNRSYHRDMQTSECDCPASDLICIICLGS